MSCATSCVAPFSPTGIDNLSPEICADPGAVGQLVGCLRSCPDGDSLELAEIISATCANPGAVGAGAGAVPGAGVPGAIPTVSFNPALGPTPTGVRPGPTGPAGNVPIPPNTPFTTSTFGTGGTATKTGTATGTATATPTNSASMISAGGMGKLAIAVAAGFFGLL
ncbi:hypothetical protein HK102_008083 [Quaeritorhiza haematococci]|nr:hypothetical protein HK102_008083 [Quaeritorhiza haematococci]